MSAPGPSAGTLPSTGARIRALLDARFALQAGAGGWPIAPLMMHAGVAALVGGLVHDQLPLFAFALVALALSAALVAIPLHGEFAYLLRADEAAEWVEALPLRPFELRVARTVHLILLLGLLSLASLVPPAVFIGLSEAGWLVALGLVACGLAQVLALAALLLAVQAIFRGRAEGLLVLFQTALMVAVVAGLVLGLRSLPLLAHLTHFGARDWTTLFPPAWFAAPLGGSHAWLPLVLGLTALTVLIATPAPALQTKRGGRSALDTLLLPTRTLLTRLWVRDDERGAFDLVYDAAPREREFVLRTYPMVGIPLAFLGVASLGSDPLRREGFLVLLLFTAGIYLPVLLTQLAGSASHGARWILESAPVPQSAIDAGALKAVAARFLLPLYLVLFGLAWSEVGPERALTWTLPAALLSLAVLRAQYPMCVDALPLSQPPDELEAKLDWSGPMLMISIALTIVAVLAWRFVNHLPAGLGASAVLLGLEVLSDRATRSLDPHVAPSSSPSPPPMES